MSITTSLTSMKEKLMSLPIISQQKLSMKYRLLETPLELSIPSSSMILYSNKKSAKNQVVSAWSPYLYTPIWIYSTMKTIGNKVLASYLPIFMSTIVPSTHLFVFRESSAWATSLIIMRANYKNWHIGSTSNLFPIVTRNFSQDKTSKTQISKTQVTMMTA